VEHAVAQTRQVGRGETGRLAVGFAGSMPFTDVMPRLLRDFRAAWPQVALDLREQPSQSQIDDLLAQRLDLGFIRTTQLMHTPACPPWWCSASPCWPLSMPTTLLAARASLRLTICAINPL
jgi:LysR substrate binding domain.